MSVSIDPNDYVEAPEGVTNLKFNDAKRQAKFELGVCMAVYKWEELNTAVENSWGGPNSGEKRDWISGIVIDLFDDKIVDIALIEETLLYAMVDEFDTEIDNDSALEIAALIFKFFKDVMVEKYDGIDQLYAKWEAKKNLRTQNSHVVVGSDPNNPSDDDEEDDDEEEEGDENLTSRGNVVEESMDVDEPAGPIVDDDGFEMVQKKGRRGGRR
ncbi:pre-rRNA-processing protein Tsr2p [[Candida] railenensis]|uniref:Pre-rRNA-processing protein Tsr2p n=1 Tax=[Candida] railenensis TaxID=45579 RepID=A0A9P0QVX9_9ASCO|nr:pre-rRNA-processing protein Tsr2p [[Candida] railenensis]